MNKNVVLIAALLLLLSLGTRVTDLGIYLTADEKNWIGRSYEFIKAFKDWRFNDMLQTTHPGVTTLWLGGGAVTAKILVSNIPFSFNNLPSFVWITQLSVALVNSLIVPLAYLLLRKLFGKREYLAVLAGVIIALDPFIVGYSRVVHVDAMLGGLLFGAVLATILYGKSGFSKKWLVVSASIAALAILTKAPAVFMLPYFILVVLVYGGTRLKEKEFVTQRIKEFIIWLLLIAILVVIIWPAILWVPNPEGNVLVLKRDIGQAALTPHNMTEEYTLNGGYYLYTLLTRTTPVVFTLALIGLFGVTWEKVRKRDKQLLKVSLKEEAGGTGVDTRVVWLLVAYIFFFVVMMMLGAKKGDRYILPVFFAIDVLAAAGAWYLVVGVSYLVSSYTKYQMLKTKYLAYGLALVVATVLGMTIYKYHPYAIAYSNPMWPDNLSKELGWGEGLEQVGRWLNENDPKAVVASWYPEELGAFTTAHVAHINAHEQGNVKYIVLYRNMFGRAPDHYANDFIDEYYTKREPVYVVEIVGKEFAWVFEKKVYGSVVKELAPGMDVRQKVEVQHADLAGIDLMAATYSGEAKNGFLVVDLIEEASGERVARWKKPVEEIQDKGWTRLKLDKPISQAGNYWIAVSAELTGDKAPTLRYNPTSKYRKSNMLINGEEKKGDLAIRTLYLVDGQIATEEDDRLLDVQ